jgi:hypothetical protein
VPSTPHGLSSSMPAQSSPEVSHATGPMYLQAGPGHRPKVTPGPWEMMATRDCASATVTVYRRARIWSLHAIQCYRWHPMPHKMPLEPLTGSGLDQGTTTMHVPNCAADALVAAECHDVPQLEGAGVDLLLLLPYIGFVLQVWVHAAGQQALRGQHSTQLCPAPAGQHSAMQHACTQDTGQTCTRIQHYIHSGGDHLCALLCSYTTGGSVIVLAAGSDMCCAVVAQQDCGSGFLTCAPQGH